MMDVAAICEASTGGDAKSVRRLLLGNSQPAPAPTGPDDPLLPSSAECRSLHNGLFGSRAKSLRESCKDDHLGADDEESSVGIKRKRPPSGTSPADPPPGAETPSNSPQILPTGEEDIVALVRALLMIPGNTYETPWEATMCAVSALQTESGIFGQQQGSSYPDGKMTMGEAVVAEIGIFLGTIGYYPRGRASNEPDRLNGGTEGDERTQRTFLRRLANLIVAPLLMEEDDDDEDCQKVTPVGNRSTRTRVVAALGLLPALFDASKRMGRNGVGSDAANSNLVTSILDRLIPPSGRADAAISSKDGRDVCIGIDEGIRPSMMALMIPLLESLGPHISQQRWLGARVLIVKSLPNIPSVDMPTLTKNLVHKVVAASYDENQLTSQSKTKDDDTANSSAPTETDHLSPSWCKLLLHSYQHAAIANSSSSLLSDVDLVLSKTFVVMLSPILIRLAGQIRHIATHDAADMPRWVASNILLLIGAASAPQNGNPSLNLVEEAVFGSTYFSSLAKRKRRDANTSTVVGYIIDAVLGFAGIEDDSPDGNQEMQQLSLSGLRSSLSRVVGKSRYTQYEAMMRKLENVVVQSIFLIDPSRNESGDADVICEARAKRYLQFAAGFLEHLDTGTGAPNSYEGRQIVLRICFALTINVVVFERVPALRHDLLLNLARELCYDSLGRGKYRGLALLAISRKVTEENGRIAVHRGVDINSKATVTLEDCEGLSDVLCGLSTFDNESGGIEHNPPTLSTDAIRILAQVLCQTSSKGRQAIFNTATQLLSSSTNMAADLPPHLESVAREPDAAILAIELLCLLLRPPGGSVLDRDVYLTSSVAKLCDMVVLNAPPLTLAIRRSLYSQIKDLAKEGEVDTWICARLGRAATCAFLNNFRFISKASEPAGDDDDDKCSTLRPVFVPERSFTSWSRPGGESRRQMHVSQVDDISSLLELLLVLRSARLRDHRDLSENLVKVIGGGGSPDILHGPSVVVGAIENDGANEKIDKLIDGVLSTCLGAIAKGIFFPSQTDESGETDAKACSFLRNKISSGEKAIFEATKTEHLYAPKWFGDNASQPFSKTEVHREVMLASITPSLCSTIFSIVLGGGLSNVDDPEHALNLAIAFNRIVQKTSAATNRDEEAPPVPMNDLSASLIEHAHHYLEASTSAFDRLLGEKSATGGSSSSDKRLYVVLKGLERCCHCIENIERNKVVPELNTKQTISSLWNIYLKVGGEEGTCRLIRYLDDRLVRAKGAGVPDLAIESHEDIDELVRSVRIAIISSLASLVKYSQKRGSNNSAMTVGLLLGKMSSLISDLYVGLNGKSGGITRNVFVAYLTAIDACVDAVLTMDHGIIGQEFSSGATNIGEAQSLVESSSIHLWNIPCKFCLDQEARTFKTTLDMALSGMQSVRRHIEFVLTYVGEDSFPSNDFCSSQNKCDSLSRASEQCVEALRKGSISTTRKRKQSSRKVIDDDSSSSDDSSSDGDDDYESDDNIESALQQSGKVGGKSASQASSSVVVPKALRRLQVNTSNAWTWTQTTVYVAIETNWAESQSILKAKNIDARTHSCEKLAIYVARRHKELSSALACAASFLNMAVRGEDGGQNYSDGEERQFNDEDEQSGILLSEMLSSTTKLRLCSTLERITTTLRAALRIISMMLKESKGGGEIAESVLTLRGSIRFGESLACLSAWFACSENGQALFTSGTRRWFHNEKARYRIAKAKAKAGGYHLDQDPILSRLPKALYQMEELEVSFQKLASAISVPSKKKNDTTCSNFLSDVDLLLSCFATSTGNTSQSNEESKSFATIVAEHRDRLASSSDSKLSSFDMALISFEDKEDDLGNATLGKRKRRGRNTAVEKHLRKAQRNVLRSRNEVVDEWLDLDADNVDRNDSMDAFADLEDFLVEG